MSTYADLVVHSISKRRAELATVSALFSIFLHVGLLIWMAVSPGTIPFWRPLFADQPPREPPMHVREVETAPAPPVITQADASSPASRRGPSVHLEQDTTRLAVPPDRVDVEPPPPSAGRESAPLVTALAEPTLPPQPEAWQPRQEILAVEHASVRDELAARPRRTIPRIERVLAAADVVYPAPPKAVPAAAPTGDSAGGTGKPSLATMLRRVTDTTSARSESVPLAESARSGSGVLAESGSDVTSLQPIEALLTAHVTTFKTRHDPESLYFKIDIQRRSEEALPVLPKDLLFIQDCSASMSEQRLYFCRQGLIDSLPLIGPQDRFNIVAFRDQIDTCFTDWTANSPEARERAATFIQGLQSRGETDVFAAIRAALTFKTEPGRPVIALLISDGHSTTGLTDGSAIIREFTQSNRGALSVFTLGTSPQAYAYLLDLLSYSNRGDSRVVTRGRWDIPKDVQGLTEEVRHPVLAEVGLRVAESTPCEVYPVQTMNVYRDRPLVLYGRCGRRQANVVFQATGRAAATSCDMIFDLNLDDAAAQAQEDLRQVWAQQKLYHLIGMYARTRDVTLLPLIDETARAYHVAVPYRDSL
ncbi:MAG: VWA domain-containing protein [Lentisphaerae bacterium]|nr:VWA domain-containing protein [Lentisphaerota bacterium]